MFSVYSGLITLVCPELDGPEVLKEPKEVDKVSEKADRRQKQARKKLKYCSWECSINNGAQTEIGRVRVNNKGYCAPGREEGAQVVPG